MTSDVLTAEQLAEMLGCNVAHIYRMARKGEIPGTKIGALWRFSRKVVSDALKLDLSSHAEEVNQ